MATRTATETKREITKKGDVVTVKEVETTTIQVPGKEPEVKEVTRVEEYKGEEGFKRLPEDIRRQLEQPGSCLLPMNKSMNKMATMGNFTEEALAELNKYRQKHGSKPLKLSQELVNVSEQRASELAKKDEMAARSDQLYGENVTCLMSNDPNHTVKGAEIILKWYDEGKKYNYKEEPKDLNAGLFTQMVWANCNEFGIGAAKSDSNKIYVVATYKPPGNFVGQFKDNVRPPGSEPPAKGNSGADGKDGKAAGNTAASGGSGASGSPAKPLSLAELNEENVKVHNQYRAKHGVPPLKFSQELANYAQEWAEELAKKDKFEHRQVRKYGENLYSFMSSDPNAEVTAAEACANWYSEIKSFNFKSEPKTLAAGHFTQMIWKDTQEVGMGRAKTKKGMVILVANYNPPGNFVGKFLENVPKPLS